jgi:hypothetical protein
MVGVTGPTLFSVAATCGNADSRAKVKEVCLTAHCSMACEATTYISGRARLTCILAPRQQRRQLHGGYRPCSIAASRTVPARSPVRRSCTGDLRSRCAACHVGAAGPVARAVHQR